MSHLYIVEIGGTRPDSLFEVHVIHVMVAGDERAMIDACHAAFAHQLAAAHIDGWVAIAVEPDDPSLALARTEHWFLLEIGRNSSSFMREQHDYRFIRASNARQAIATVRREAPDWHVDTVVNVEDLAVKHGWRLSFGADPTQCAYRQVSRYIRFDRM